MNSFKVKAFKQTSTSFEALIEAPDGIITHVKLSIADYKFSSKANYLNVALRQVIENYIRLEEDTYYAQEAITADALGSIHQNSFISRDFQIPKKS